MKKLKNGILFALVILLNLNAFSELVRYYSSSKTHTQQSGIFEMRNDEIPKYIFLFIGDGMSYPQIQLANYYKNAMNQNSSSRELLKNQNQENKKVYIP